MIRKLAALGLLAYVGYTTAWLAHIDSHEGHIQHQLTQILHNQCHC